MPALFTILIFIFGSLIGSFLNVVIYRLNSGKSIVRGRSICMTCSRTLAWYELIPIFSFLIQSGRCRTCATSISRQYPLVELISGAVFVMIANYFLPVLYVSVARFAVLYVLVAAIFSILLVIAVYDIRHKIIPQQLVYTFALLSLILLVINQSVGGGFIVIPSIYALLAGPVLASPFALLWLVSRGQWMGYGDAKLALGIGWMLGFDKGIASLILSFWMGAIVGIICIAVSRKKYGMKTQLPFAPFLILGAAIAFFFSVGIATLAGFFTL